LPEILRTYLETYGYLFLFLGTFLEGEAVLILAGFFAFQQKLNIFAVIAVSFAGSFLGDQFYFYIGRWRGSWLLNLFPRIARKSRRALRLVEKHGSFVAFISRFTYGFRIILPIVLGMTRLSKVVFFRLNLLSALSWAIIFSLAGFIFGKSASYIIEDLDAYEPYIVLTLMGLIGCFWFGHVLRVWWKGRPARERLSRMRKARERRNRKQ
jgi:membrane protein DedA with SNARE-associated domain